MLKPLTDDTAPWKQRYRAPAIYYSSIAKQNPTKGLVADNRTGTLQWQAWDVAANNLRQITYTEGGNSSFLFLAPHGDWVYYLHDDAGNELGHYVRMPYEGGDIEDITPDLPNYSSFGFTISASGNRIAFMCAYNQQFFIYCLDVAPDGTLSNLRPIHQTDKLIEGAWLSRDGDVVATISTERSGSLAYSILAFDATTGETIGELWEDSDNSVQVCCFAPHANDPRMLATTTVTGIETLLIWDPRTGERTDLQLHGVEGSVLAFDWSRDDVIVCRSINAAIHQMYVHDLKTHETRALEYPSGICGSPYFVPNSDLIFTGWENSTSPARVIAISSKTGKYERIVLAAGEVPAGRAWKSVTFPSSDGQMIQAWLGIPEGEGPFPTILDTHGGPTSVQTNGFKPSAQAWLDHGFAYISVNYRGSTTFGRAFEQQIWGNLGHWEVEDMVAARTWLVAQGIAKPDEILLTGWSYGGYLTLLAMGKMPDLWAGGMAGVAITDWVMSYEDSADTLKGYQVSLFGGTPEQKLAEYQRSSPITYAEQFNAPILIIQGVNDTRTPARPVRVFEQTLSELDKDIQVHWFDTGHAGSATSTEIGIQHQVMMLEFAYRVLNWKT